MLSKFTTLALIFTFPLIVFAQGDGKRTAPAGDVKQQVLKVSREISKASLRNDVETLDRLLSDDFRMLGPRGEFLGDKQAILALTKAGRLRITYHKDRVLSVRVNGKRVIVLGESVTKGIRDGQAFDNRYRSSDVFMKQDGQWRNVLTQLIRFLPQ